MRLSKYMAHTGFLDNGMFRFTQPASLNDAADARPVLLNDQYAREDLAVATEAANRAGIRPRDRDDLEMFLAPFPAGRFCENGFPGLLPFHEPRLRAEPFTSIREFDQAMADLAVQLCLEQVNRAFLVFSMTTAVGSEVIDLFPENVPILR